MRRRQLFMVRRCKWRSIITTKPVSKESRANVSYSGYVSLSDWFKTADFMDTRRHLRTDPFEYEGYDTDWLEP